MEDFILNEIMDTQDEASNAITDNEILYDDEGNSQPAHEDGMPNSIDDPEYDPYMGEPYEEPFIHQEMLDRNGDGQTDMIIMEDDSDGDGINETEIVLADNNYDGVFESSVIDTDEDGNGFIDTRKRELDTDGDGVVDYKETVIDTNHNGVFDENDSVEYTHDSNHFGSIDSYKIQIDTDGDGIIDYAELGRDYNNDGVFDSLKIYEDTTGNGKLDTMTELYDSTGDGKLDTAEIHYDYDGDGVEDWTQFCIYNPDSGSVTPLNDTPEYANIAATYSWELPQYQPNENYPEGISGDPATSMEYWEPQGESGPCALYSQMFIIEEFTGQDIDINEFTAMAEENGWYGPGGTTPLNMSKMLDAYGIENEMSFHNDINDIEECLEEGGKVIVAIDADEIWHGEGGDLFSPNATANHAVEVIGIDYTNPEKPMVILNDSGSPNGRGEMVPLDDFLDAWKDSECQMIKCYPNK